MHFQNGMVQPCLPSALETTNIMNIQSSRSFYQRGFTMIELAVSISIASFVVIGLYGLFTLQTRQLMTQDMRMEMHQNSRFGLEILSRSIRMAGFGSNGFIYGIMGTGGADSNVLPAVISYDNNGSLGSDAITVAYMEPSLVMDTTYSTIERCDTTSITFNPNHLDNNSNLMYLKAGDLLMCQDYAAIGAMETYLWTIAADASSTVPLGAVSVNSAASITDYTGVCPSTENLSPIMRCSKGQVMTFYIDNTDDGVGPGSEAHPVLMMDLNMNFPNNDDVPLVDNVEDLQFEYCLDNGALSASCVTPGLWADTILANQVPLLWKVQISMVLRSPKDDFFEAYTGRRPQLANNSQGASTDQYYRDTVITQVTVRNMRLLSSN